MIEPVVMTEDNSQACWRCGQPTCLMFWACERGGPLKEEGYKRPAKAGVTSIAEVYSYVFDVLEEHGITPQ